MEKLQVVISGDATKLIAALKQSGVNIKDFASDTEKAGGSAKTAGLSVNSMVAGLAGMQIAQQAAGWMKDFAVESFNAAAQSERLGRATDSLAGAIGSSGEEMVNAIKGASLGTVSEVQAMEAANKALMFGLVQNSDQMGELTQIAITLGAAMGQGAGKSVDDLTTALGRQSPMILDNLGITLKMEEAYQIYADSLGKTVEQLTEAEKKQAFVNAALEKGKKRVDELGGIQLDTAAKQEILSAKTTDFKAKFGELMVTMEEGTGFIDGATGAIEQMAEGAESWGYVFETIGVLVDQNNTKFDNHQKVLRRLGMSQQEYEYALRIGTMTLDDYDKALRYVVQTGTRENAQAIAMTTAKKNMAWATKEAEAAQSDLNEVTEEAAKLIAEQKKQVEDLMSKQAEMAGENKITIAGYYGDVTDFAQNSKDSQAKFIEDFSELQRQIGEATTAEKKAQLQQQLEDLRAARAEELAMEEEARNELKLKTALNILETTGQLESLMNIAGVSASDAYDLITAGIVEVDAELAGALQKTMGDFTGKAEEVETQAGENAETLKQVYAGAFSDISLASENAKNSMVGDANLIKAAYEDAMDAFDRMMAAGATAAQAADAARYTGLAGYYNNGNYASGTPAGGFTVPPGYPNDSYMVGLTSGENVSVSRSGGGSGGGGVTINSLAIYANDAAGGRAAGTAFQNELRARGLM